MSKNKAFTDEIYTTFLLLQGGVCGLCRKDRELELDHDHGCCKKQKRCGYCYRGLLCRSCNQRMGRLDELLNLGVLAVTVINSMPDEVAYLCRYLERQRKGLNPPG
jgi:hypothetical protein